MYVPVNGRITVSFTLPYCPVKRPIGIMLELTVVRFENMV